ncbi:MAG: ABC transporter ATP-binding protein [Nitrososphaerota archaeon]
MLNVYNIYASYGRMKALTGVSLEVSEGEFVAVIGPNGAGKSTLLKAISGLINIEAGSIHYRDVRIDGLTPWQICDMGIIHVPEGRKIFPNMTVKENLELGAYSARARRLIKTSFDEVYSLFPRLKERERQLAKTLSGGEQQMLAIGRGIMGRPSLMMLDEPTMSLSPKLASQIFETLKIINNRGVTILLVSQEVFHALSFANRAYVVENGHILVHGPAEVILKSEYVKEAYLGF